MSNISGLNSTQELLKRKVEAMSLSNVVAGRGDRSFVIAHGSGDTSRTCVVSQKTMHEDPNNFTQTDNYLHAAINGQGCAVVKVNGRLELRKDCAFEIDNQGYLVDPDGYRVQGWERDDNGNLPIAYTSVDSLKDINIYGVRGKPKATTSIIVEANLNADISGQIKGPNQVVKFSAAGPNQKTGPSDVIIEGTSSIGSFRRGDTFILNSNPPGVIKSYQYGGLAISKQAQGLFGAQDNVQGRFVNIIQPTNAPVGANQLQDGIDGITVTVSDGTVSKIHTYLVSENFQVGQGKFNSLDSLRKELEYDGFVSTVKDGRIYIGAFDANNSLTFNSIGNASMVSALGLADVPLASTNLPRFNTEDGLRRLINKDRTITGLAAEFMHGGLQIRSRLATSDFVFDIKSQGVQPAQYGWQGTIDPACDPRGLNTHSTTYIMPNHGFQQGDWIQDEAGTRYFVSRTTTDTLTIASVVPGQAALAPQFLNNANHTFIGSVGTIPQPINTASALAATNGNDVIDITLSPFAAGTYNANDKVLITGVGHVNAGGVDIAVPDGVYEIQNIVGNVVTIQAHANSATGTTNPNIQTSDIRVRKICTQVEYAANLDTKVMDVTTGSNEVTLYMNPGTYKKGDYITLDGITGTSMYLGSSAPAANDGILISNQTRYKITDVTANSIAFAVPGNNAQANESADLFGTHAGFAVLGNDFVIDNKSQVAKEAQLDQSTSLFTKTYAGLDSPRLSLASGAHSDTSNVSAQDITVYDSLGVAHQIQLIVALLDPDANIYALEVRAVDNPKTNSTDLQHSNNPYNLVESGFVSFDNTGQFITADAGISQVTFDWNNGSAANIITFVLNPTEGSTGLYMTSGETQFSKIDQDGHPAGEVGNPELTAEGNLSLKIGEETIQKYTIAIGLVNNPNGLASGVSGYVPTIASGPLMLAQAGHSGAGSLMPGYLETSNVDPVTSIIDLAQISQYAAPMAKAVKEEQDAKKTIIGNAV